ncbi:hypothetical protein GJ496_011455 [Pomphorhynchus laevis]|nr:hypothetical protein GJ496_011455 [Pomphorhynchus laevis]
MRMCEPLLAGISGNELRHQQYSLASLIRAEKDQFAHGKLANLTVNKLEVSEVVRQASCKGASSWLSSKPLKHLGYTMTKIAFHDAVAARYNWMPPNCPLVCVCGENVSVRHALAWVDSSLSDTMKSVTFCPENSQK